MGIFDSQVDLAANQLQSQKASDSFRNSLVLGEREGELNRTKMNCILTFSGSPNSGVSVDYFETLQRLASPSDGTILHPSLDFLSWIPGKAGVGKHVALFKEKLLLGAETDLVNETKLSIFDKFEQPQEPFVLEETLITEQDDLQDENFGDDHQGFTKSG